MVLWKDVIKISNVTFALARIIFTVEIALWIALKSLAQTVIAPVAEVLKTKTYKNQPPSLRILSEGGFYSFKYSANFALINAFYVILLTV